jgi:hypothetical protein
MPRNFFPIMHTLFSDIKAWLAGTHHGQRRASAALSAGMVLPLQSRNLADGVDGYLIRRAVECDTITYDQLTSGLMLAALIGFASHCLYSCAACLSWIGILGNTSWDLEATKRGFGVVSLCVWGRQVKLGISRRPAGAPLH